MKLYKPMTGDTREVKRFAWYPIRVNGVVYWLEWITIHQSYNTRCKGWNNDWRVDE